MIRSFLLTALVVSTDNTQVVVEASKVVPIDIWSVFACFALFISLMTALYAAATGLNKILDKAEIKKHPSDSDIPR